MGTNIGFIIFLLRELPACLESLGIVERNLKHAEKMFGQRRDQISFDNFNHHQDNFQTAKTRYDEMFTELQAEVDKLQPGLVASLHQVHLSGVITHDEMLQAIQAIIEKPPSDELPELPISDL